MTTVTNSKIDGITYLKHLLRFGLDIKVFNDYKRYGIISCSECNCIGNKIKSFQFIDFAGIEDEWIDKILETEHEQDISVYHIIHSLGNNEFVCMYCNNYDIKDYKNFNPEGVKHINEFENYNKFILGETKCFRYYPETNKVKFGSVKFKVKTGGIIEIK